MQAQTIDETADICVMLLGEYLGWSHYAGLVSVVNCNQAGHECDHRLAASYITLKQAVHLASAAHVVADLAYHAFLGIGQAEGEFLVIETVEVLAHFTEYESLEPTLTVAGKAGQVELYVEEFLELDSELSQSKLERGARVMQYLEGIGQGHKMLLLSEPVGKCLGQRLYDEAHQVVYQLADGG